MLKTKYAKKCFLVGLSHSLLLDTSPMSGSAAPLQRIEATCCFTKI